MLFFKLLNNDEKMSVAILGYGKKNKTHLPYLDYKSIIDDEVSIVRIFYLFKTILFSGCFNIFKLINMI
ncbi:hypothetical protein CN938_29780 [Bacillus thuringiensis]|nr:hypothetical protein CN938_29780 [Bacillus thuringiensis]